MGEHPRDHTAKTKRSVQLVTGLGSMVAPFLVASMIVAAPTIGTDLGAEVALLPWLTAAFFLVAASLLIPVGRVADAWGSKKIFTAGILVYIASTTICALAPNMGVLIIGRGLTGAGAAMVFGTSIALLSLVFSAEDRGKAIGINVTFMAIGFISGLLAGGFLTYYLGWRSLFVIAFVVAVVNLFLLRSRVKGECEISRTKELDPAGIVLFSAGLLLSFYGLSNIIRPVGGLALLAGGAVLAALVLWERRRPNPIIGRKVSRDRSFVLAVVTNILFQAGVFAMVFLLSLHLQYVSGLDARAAGFLLLASQVPTSALSAVSGRLISRIGNRKVIVLSAAISALGLAVLLTVSEDTSVLVLLTSLALLGSGAGLFMPTVVNWALSTIAREDYGVASAVSETARLTGMTLSNVIMLILITLFLGSGSVEPDNIDDFLGLVRACALIYLALILASVVPVMFIKKRGFEGNR
jgi:MFS family permease